MLSSTLLATAKTSSASTACRVLLVGTGRRNNGRLQQFLAENMPIKATDDANEGIALACDGGYEIVLIDMALSATDRFEVLRLIRARCDIPILVLAGSAVRDRITALR